MIKEQFSSISYRAKDINDEDILDVSGHLSKIDYTLVTDFDKFEVLYKKADELYKNKEREPLKKGLENLGIALSAETYTRMVEKE